MSGIYDILTNQHENIAYLVKEFLYVMSGYDNFKYIDNYYQNKKQFLENIASQLYQDEFSINKLGSCESYHQIAKNNKPTKRTRSLESRILNTIKPPYTNNSENNLFGSLNKQYAIYINNRKSRKDIKSFDNYLYLNKTNKNNNRRLINISNTENIKNLSNHGKILSITNNLREKLNYYKKTAKSKAKKEADIEAQIKATDRAKADAKAAAIAQEFALAAKIQRLTNFPTPETRQELELLKYEMAKLKKQ